jgi:hypothetical protein
MVEPINIYQQLPSEAFTQGFSGGILEQLVAEATLDLGSDFHVPIIKALIRWVKGPDCFPKILIYG